MDIFLKYILPSILGLIGVIISTITTCLMTIKVKKNESEINIKIAEIKNEMHERTMQMVENITKNSLDTISNIVQVSQTVQEQWTKEKSKDELVKSIKSERKKENSQNLSLYKKKKNKMSKNKRKKIKINSIIIK